MSENENINDDIELNEEDLVIRDDDFTELSSDEVTSENLKKLLSGSEFEDDAEIDDDGDLMIKKDGITYFAVVNEDSKYIKFFTRWQKGSSINEGRLARVVNKWNNDKVFTRAACDDEDIDLDYFLTFEGGVHKDNFVDTFRWLFSLGVKFGKFLNDEDAID